MLNFNDDSLERISLEGAELHFTPRCDLGIPADDLFAQLLHETTWREEAITIFGRTQPQPRLVAWYGDEGASYEYSGIEHDPLPWTTTLTTLRDRMAKLTGGRYNSVLLNLYRNERDSMGMHADDEPELGPEPVIASLSLGEERSICFQHRHRRDLKNLNLPLPSGSLLVMRGSTQKHWKHGLRKLRRPCGPRINLTFRWIEADQTRRVHLS